jgi:DNA repair exonuclease SbcCD nuclease subunit
MEENVELVKVKKIIACADVHIPALKGIEELKVYLTKFIDECKKIVKEEGGPEFVRIVIAGDIFHNKTDITNESMLCANWFFSELDKICKTIVIAGNHDMLMNNLDRVDSISPLFEIGNFKNVIFLDKELGFKSGVYEDYNIAWCLYSSFSGFNTPDIGLSKETCKYDNEPLIYVGLIHTDVNGAITVTNYVTDKGIDPGVFDGCDFVIAGHIHKRQEIKKNGVRIVYCSSIKQREFGETVSGHGFVLWDVEDPDDIEYKYVDIKDDNGGYFAFGIKDIKDIENDNEELINY